MFKSSKAFYFWLGLILTIVALLPLPLPATWYQNWGHWLILAVGILILFWAPFAVWLDTEKERGKLQTEIDNMKPDVKLTDFHPELEYRIMVGSRNRKIIVIRLSVILRNTSMRNYGSLAFFQIDIQTPRGFYRAVSNDPPLGYRFEPNSIYRNHVFTFSGDLSDPDIGIESWEPYIQGKEGKINLSVQGQEIKTYDIKIANNEGFS